MSHPIPASTPSGLEALAPTASKAYTPFTAPPPIKAAPSLPPPPPDSDLSKMSTTFADLRQRNTELARELDKLRTFTSPSQPPPLPNVAPFAGGLFGSESKEKEGGPSVVTPLGHKPPYTGGRGVGLLPLSVASGLSSFSAVSTPSVFGAPEDTPPRAHSHAPAPAASVRLSLPPRLLSLVVIWEESVCLCVVYVVFPYQEALEKVIAERDALRQQLEQTVSLGCR